MALVRITPDNAVDTVRQQLDAFAESVASSGRDPAMLKLADEAEKLARLAASGCLEVEVLGLGGLHPAWSGVIAKWLGIDHEPLARIEGETTTVELAPDPLAPVSVVRVRSQLDTPPRRAGARVAPILIVARGGREAPDKETLDQVLTQIRSRPLTLLLAPKGADWAKALSGLGSRDTWVCKPREIEELASTSMTLAESMGHPPWRQAGQFAAGWSIAGALASLYDAFAVALEKEDRAARAKKAAVEQRAQKLQGTPMPTEILGEVRGLLQKQFDRFQKEVSRGLKELVTPQEGTLWREIDTAVDTLDRFDSVKKPKVDVVTIPADFQQPLMSRIKEVLGSVCRSSLVELHDFLRDIKDKVERALEERGGPPVVLNFQHLPADRVDVVLQRSVAIQRPYKGEITRKGVMDFFMAARRYQMLFFMVFSAFGLSFIRSFTAFTIPAGMVLMAYGMLNVINGARKQRAETEQKELDKARDMLRSELSRAMADVQKTWDQTVSTFLGDQQNAALELIEGAVRSSSALGSRQAAGDKELVQQQIKSLDAAQRKLAEGTKKAEAAGDELEQIRGSLIQFYVAATNAPEAGAAGGVSIPKPELPASAAAALEKLKQAQAGKPAAAGAGASMSEKLARLRAGGSAGAAAGAKPAAPAARPGGVSSGQQAKPATDPETLRRQAEERLKALKEKARGTAAKTPTRKDRT
ncbi:MAG: hypothetical protein ACRD2Z_13540 [Thermoanaerobaculia bacterium]